MSTTSQISIPSKINIKIPTNDNTQNNCLGINASNQVEYLDLSTLSVTGADQTLNTTSDATFNQVTTNYLDGIITQYASGIPNSIMNMLSTNNTFIGFTATTTNNTNLNVYSFNIPNNTCYIVYLEAIGNSVGNGAGGYVRSVRVSNVAGTVTTAQLKYFSNTTGTNMNGATINVTISGTTVYVYIKGVNAFSIDWTGFINLFLAS
jgi:hypothetical protein